MSAIIKIGSTYYKKGFFNQTKKMHWLPKNTDYSNTSILIQCTGPKTNAHVSAEIRYRGKNGKGRWINASHHARVFAKPSKPLVRWFADNISEGDSVLFEQVDELNYTMKSTSKTLPQPPLVVKTSGQKQSPSDWSKEDDWFWEGNIQNKIIGYLRANGFDKVCGVDTSTKEQGPDIIAHEGAKRWVIEVKGYPSDKYVEDRGDKKKGTPKPTRPATQARHWFSEAMMSIIVAKSEAPTFEVGLGFPRKETYLTLLNRISYVREKLSIHVFLVDENGEVSKFSPQESIQ